MKRILAILALLSATLPMAQAGTVTSLIGAEDGFGIGVLPGQGFDWSLITGAPGPGNTNAWIDGSNTWTQTYDITGLGPLTSATISVFCGGLGYDDSSPDPSLWINGDFIGSLTSGDDAGPLYNYAELDTFSLLPFSSLLTGSDTFTIQTSPDDGWVFGYSLLQFTGPGSVTSSAVPDAGMTVGLLAISLVGLAAFRRRVTA
jgi:hypothetical protein